jgi:hypothetical protein
MREIRNLLLAMLLLPASSALAADRVVPSASYSTMQAAIDAAESGDRVLVGPGIYNERLNFRGKRIALQSQRGPYLTILDPQGGGDHLVRCHGTPEGTSIEGFTFRLATISAVSIIDNGHVSISNCRFASNNSDYGGAIRVVNASSLQATNCEFTFNTASRGGAIASYQSAISLTSCLFQNNAVMNSDGGGAILVEGSSDPLSPTISDCRFLSNRANVDTPHIGAWGGAIRLANCAGTILNCEFTGNSASVWGGGNHCGGGSLRLDNASPSLMDCTFTNCKAGLEANCFGGLAIYGGSISAWSGSSPTFTRCQWLGSRAIGWADCGTRYAQGGAVHLNELCNPRFVACSFDDCRAIVRTNEGRDAYGGAIFMRRSSPLIEDCEFSGCRAEGFSWPGGLSSSYGGALWCQYYASPIILNSRFDSNWAWRGGAIYEEGLAAPVILGCLFQSNAASEWGGAIGAWDSPAVIAENLFESNTSDQGQEGSAVRAVGSQTPALSDNYFCSNTGVDLFGSYVNGGGNIVLENCQQDCNQNGLSDGWDLLSGLADCDANGVLDVCDIAANPQRDCNQDGALDVCTPGVSDCDANGVADTCQADCDADGVPDACEIAQGAADCDGNGVPDSCQMVSGDRNHDQILDACQRVDFTGLRTEIVPMPRSISGVPSTGLCYRIWAEVSSPDSRVYGFFGDAGSAMSVSAAGGFFQATGGGNLSLDLPCGASGALAYDSWLTVGRVCGDGDQVQTIGIDLAPFASGGGVATSNGAVFAVPDSAQTLAGGARRVLLMQLTTQQATLPTGQINLLGSNADGSDWLAYGMAIPAPTLIDCNGNGTHDAIDIVLGESDCNTNGIPDSCESAQDCNGNGVADGCDISGGVSDDLNANGIPDECECPGDIDGNASVDIDDLIAILLSWGDTGQSPADVDGSGMVDAADLSYVLVFWGGC